MLSMSASGGKADVDQPMLTNLDLSFSRQGPPSLACDSGKASVTQGRLWRGAPDMGILPCPRLLGFLALLWASAGLGCYPMCYPELLTLLFLAVPEGFEPSTLCLEGRCCRISNYRQSERLTLIGLWAACIFPQKD